MTHEQIQNLFPEGLYEALPSEEKKQFDEHISTCDSCRKEFAELRRTLDIMSKRTRPEPTDKDWKAFGERLKAAIAPQSETTGDRSMRKLRPGLIWRYAAAAMFLIVFGIFIGRTIVVDEQSALTSGTDPALPAATSPLLARATTDEALEYLERSRNLLIGLTNLDEEQSASLDLTRHREVSRELYDQGQHTRCRAQQALTAAAPSTGRASANNFAPASPTAGSGMVVPLWKSSAWAWIPNQYY